MDLNQNSDPKDLVNQDSINNNNNNDDLDGDLDDDSQQQQQQEIDEWEQVRAELRIAANETRQAMIEASNDSRLLADPFKLQVLKKFLCPSLDSNGECLWQTKYGCLFQHDQPDDDDDDDDDVDDDDDEQQQQQQQQSTYIPFPDWICFGFLSDHCDKTEEDCFDGVHLTFEQLNDLDSYQRDHYESIENFRIKCLME